MNDWVNFQQLQYFNKIYEFSSIARAAEDLRISPPALSMQLKSLEERLGFPLFERKNKKLFPTEFAKNVYEYSKELDILQDDVLSLINKGGKTIHQKMRIGLNDAVPKSLSLLITKKLLKLEKKIDISIEENSNQTLAQKILSNQMDIGFSNIPIIDQNGEILCQEFAKEPVAFYASKKFEKLKSNFPESLSFASFILPSRHSDIRHSIDYWFAANQISYGKIIEVQDSSVKKLLACDGLGIVPLPTFGAKSYLKSGELIKISDLDNVYEKYYWMVKKSKYKQSELIEKLVQSLGQILKK